jgi:uncharacterized RDD family membrane protein YckC
VRYVGVGRRFLATVVDGVISIAWMAPFLDIERSPGYFRAELGGGGSVAYLVISLVYLIAMEAFFGATVGKFATGTRVVRDDGGRIDGTAAVIRNVARVVDVLPFAYLIGAIAVWTSSTRQRLGDRWASTVVVEASSVGERRPTPGPSWAPPPPATAPPVTTPTGHPVPPPIPPPPPVPGSASPANDPWRRTDDLGRPTAPTTPPDEPAPPSVAATPPPDEPAPRGDEPAAPSAEPTRGTDDTGETPPRSSTST